MISTEIKKEITVETNNHSNGTHAKEVPPTQTGQEKQRNWLTLIGLLVASLALLANAYGIRELHTLNRRHFAAEMIRDWNEHSSKHKAAIESAFPKLFIIEGPMSARPPLTPEEARMIYFSREGEGFPFFGLEDFVDGVGLFSKLKTERDPFSIYLRGRFAPATRRLLDQYTPPYKPSPELNSALVEEFNNLLNDASLFDAERFEGIQLRSETKNLLNQRSPSESVRLNRMLLEDTYPKEIARSSEKSPSLWETRQHIVALLNYFEFLAAAWENQVADREMIEHSFKHTILRWYRDLYEFMVLIKKTRNYEPWPPLQRLVEHWKQEGAEIRIVPPTGSLGGR